MTRAEIIATVGRLLAADGTEQQLEAMLRALIQIAPQGEFVDLIFYPDRPRSAEEIADEAILRERVRSARRLREH